MALDLVERERLGHAGLFIQILRVAEEVGEVDQPRAVAAEVRVVDGVEAQQRGEQAPVGLGDGVARQVAPGGQVLLQARERGEHAAVGRLVGLLGAGEAGAVDAVLQLGVDPAVELVDLGAPAGRIQVAAGPVVEDPHDLGRLVVDDPARLSVPQHGDADAAVVVLDRGLVGLAEEAEAVEVVREAPAREGPAALVAVRVEIGDPEPVLEAEHGADDRGALGPRAGQRDVQVVALRTALGAVAEAALLADELAAAGGGGHPPQYAAQEFTPTNTTTRRKGGRGRSGGAGAGASWDIAASFVVRPSSYQKVRWMSNRRRLRDGRQPRACGGAPRPNRVFPDAEVRDAKSEAV